MTTLREAIRIRREFDDAEAAMRVAMSRFESARQAYMALPLSFQDDGPEDASVMKIDEKP